LLWDKTIGLIVNDRIKQTSLGGVNVDLFAYRSPEGNRSAVGVRFVYIGHPGHGK